ncbi:MerR family transcriptional regulator [Patiriisocius hiemis]|uniref:MerR family transcriptional regulator n=1 Tax=Patiriisocius hiemis TaxID=3075604 RepID=A0ABU2YC11_9FLAO|nr:MerR family transcriptional regulator [Constantimarinum sp. W242]MDT0555727.1 MerR family transcriptional regulator [Constantimarinum sp. W242]
MYIKSTFSIKDLENLTGVKAHTIRIWEKRYNLLSPERTKTNIRNYDLESFKKLLNVTFLYNQGYKISKIAKLQPDEISKLVKESSKIDSDTYAINSFKSSMFEFSNSLFSKTYDELAAKKTFRQIFISVFIPLLKEIGILWQIGTIDPIHESFISECIKQKIIVAASQDQPKKEQKNAPIFALFLPFKEMHDIGLMYANYELIKAGFKTIYLGSSIPVENLVNLKNYQSNIYYLSYLTTQPETTPINNFLEKLINILDSKEQQRVWLMGPKVKNEISTEKVRIVKGFEDFFSTIKTLKKS